jgi:hypothetical protein
MFITSASTTLYASNYVGVILAAKALSIIQVDLLFGLVILTTMELNTDISI